MHSARRIRSGRHVHSVALATRRVQAFTLIELMVVIAIIMMAAGLMIPSLADFFRNKALDGIRTQVTSSLGSARLQAVAGNRSFAVVFFQEGVRIYDMTRQTWWEGDPFTAKTGAFADEEVHVDLIFAGVHTQCTKVSGGQGCYYGDDHMECLPGTECKEPGATLPRYEDWWWVVTHGEAGGAGAASGPAAGAPNGNTVRFGIDGLVGIHYSRDGTMRPLIPNEIWTRDPGAEDTGSSPHPPISKRFLSKKGNDVPAALFKNEEAADIIIWQRGNDYASFVDLQMTGAVNSKVASASKILDRFIVDRR